MIKHKHRYKIVSVMPGTWPYVKYKWYDYECEICRIGCVISFGVYVR